MMLTKGLASCIVLDLIPTPENRVLAKKTMEKSCFQVVYTGNNHNDPLCICTALVEKNPHKFQAYPDSPPPSPQLVPLPSPSPPVVVRQSEQAVFGDQRDTATSVVTNKPTSRKKSINRAMQDKNQSRENRSTTTASKMTATTTTAPPKETKPNSSSKPPRNLITALKDNPAVIMRVAKALFVRTHGCDDSHCLVYATDKVIYNVLEQHIPISRVWTLEELVQALKDNEDHFEGYDEVIGIRQVRLLYMIRENQQTRTVKKVLFDSIPNLCT